MGSVGGKVRSNPSKSVGARICSVRPKIRTPAQPGTFWPGHGPRSRAVKEALISTDLTRDQPFHGKSGLICVRFGIERCRGITCVDPTREITELSVRKTFAQDTTN